MSRLYTAGAEIHGFGLGAGGLGTFDGDQFSGSSSVPLTRDTSVFRSGAASYKCDSGAGNTAGSWGTPSAISITGANTWYYRVYVRLVTAPSAASEIMCLGGTLSQDPLIRLRTDGGLEFLVNNVVQGSATASIADSSWHRLEISGTTNGSFQWTAAEARLDGVTIGTAWTGTVSNGSDLRWGWGSAPGANTVIHFDDIGFNNASGAANNTWLGDGKVILMKPTADTQRGSWTGGSGGTTNLFTAVDNTPPTGTASENDTTQIESTDSSGNNATDEYRGDCGSYTTAGIGASDTINAVTAMCSHGEDVATNTKTGSFGVQSNPSQTYDTFTFGLDVGALGTWASGNWAQAIGTPQDAPSVTKGSSLIIAVRKTDAGTRVASVCFLGAYVDYTPAAAAIVLQQGFVDFNDPGVL